MCRYVALRSESVSPEKIALQLPRSSSSNTKIKNKASAEAEAQKVVTASKTPRRDREWLRHLAFSKSALNHRDFC